MASPQLQQSGNKIVRVADGATVTLRGPHLYFFTHKWQNGGTGALIASALELDWAERAMASLAEGGWGGRMMTFWVDTQGLNNSRYMQHVDDLVDLAEKYGGYLLLSWHNDWGQSTHTKLIDSSGRAAMATLAERYGPGTGHQGTVVYGVQAEPPGGIGISWSELMTACEQTIDAIRAEDPLALVGIPGLNWSQRMSDWMSAGGPNRDNIFAKPHLYSGRNNGSSIENSMENSGANDLYFNEDIPVVVGEYGIGSRSNETDVVILMNRAEEREWGYQAWALAHLSSLGMFTEESAGSSLTHWGTVFRRELMKHAEADEVSEPAPNAFAEASPRSGAAPLTVQFTDASTGTISSWSWDFGDGSPTSSDPNPTHEYVEAGAYSAVLTVSGPGGVDTTTLAISVDDVAIPPPVAQFAASPMSGEVPLTVQFTDQSVGEVDDYRWDFGDGSAIGIQRNPSHVYLNNGSFTVRLTVFGPGGQSSATARIGVAAPGQPPPTDPGEVPIGLPVHEEHPTLYDVRILDRARRPKANLDTFLSLTYQRTWQEGDKFVLNVYERIFDEERNEYIVNPAAEYLREDWFVEVRLRFSEEEEWKMEFLGVIEHADLTLMEAGGATEEVWEVRGISVIQRRIIIPPHGESHEKLTGPAETVLKQFMLRQFVNPVQPQRRMPDVEIEPDLGRGDTVTAKGRYGNLLTKLTEVGQMVNIGWELRSKQGGIYEFALNEGVDRSHNQSENPVVTFSPDYGNIELLNYQWSMLKRATTAYVGGQGEGIERQVINTHSTGSSEHITFFSAIELDGEHAKIQFPNEATVRLQKVVTWEGWVMLEKDGDENPIWNETIWGDVWSRFRVSLQDRLLTLSMRPERDGGFREFQGSVQVPLDTWMHLAVHVDFPAGEVRLHTFVPDGADVVDTFAVPTHIQFHDRYPQHVLLGWRIDTGEHTKMKAEEVRLWFENRTDAQVLEFRNLTLLEPERIETLEGHWAFHDAAGQTARDSSKAKNDGFLKNGASWSQGFLELVDERAVDEGPQGWVRRETFIDARDLELEESLRERGLSKLREQGPKSRIEAKILPIGPFRYRSEWDLGDLVTVTNLEWGVKEHLRIIKVDVTLEAGKLPDVEVGFGASIVNYPVLVERETKRADPVLRV